MIHRLIKRCIVAGFAMPAIFLPQFCKAIGLSQELQGVLLDNARETAPITIEWEYRRSDGPSLIQEDRERYTFTNGKFYLGATSLHPASLGHSEYCFDGSLFYSGGTNKAILAKSLVRSAAPVSLVYLHYFDDTCIVMPKTPAELLGGKPIHRILQSLESGATLATMGPIQLDGKQLLGIRLIVANEYRESAWQEDLRHAEQSARKWATSEGQVQGVLSTIQREREMPPQLVDSYYLDPSLHYAVTRWEQAYPDGTIILRCDNSDFERLGSRAVWLPTNCVRNYFWNTQPPVGFKFSATPFHIEVCHVIAMSDRADPAAQFSLNYTKPGTVIIDGSQPNIVKTYQIPTPLENLVEGPRFSLARKLFIAANIVLLGWLIYYFWKRTVKMKTNTYGRK